MLDNNIWAGTPRPYKYRRQINMKPESKKYSTTLGNNVVTFETGKLAGQAGGAVTFGTGEAIVFAAATMGGVREGIDFFPLQVEYEERMSAGGKIPGSFFRREGRPGTDAILTCRLIDRPLRPRPRPRSTSRPPSPAAPLRRCRPPRRPRRVATVSASSCVSRCASPQATRPTCCRR